jgi:1-acyl-sn-glycerol-3-phosphate acyltransferase
MNYQSAPAPAIETRGEDCGLYPEGTFGHTLRFRGSYCMTTTLMTLGFSLRTGGMRHMPMHGPALLVANHQSYLDPPLVGVAARRELIYLARKTLFRNRFFAGLIRAYNAVPIDQEGIGKEGLRTILEQLARRRAVLVFPEGARTADGRMQPLRPGIHLIIKRSPAPIVPVGIAGAYDAWPIWRPYPVPAPLFLPASRRCIAVVIGPPLNPARYAALPRDEAMGELFARIAEVQERAERLRRKR